ncbi:hypothetical protein Skr01_46930 [Sphaerisporangium krabiense]|uniref:Outer membrane protein assembly factor BamB n=1 Tax=Sphaerisporangium krabiense TaxID=763782 RepID=A0A7W8Z4E6_9ACTN|nr:PQQ-binding-like beta-propeller repeat protein [Sphaerisporangium krabiense]MBB5627258.1 outer membrane protein assembly factor BamB [Sphaerisporangium krabiense]GII64608.1 hypothetical protein Skr01_46930 [Sphaerisporangium krabiense]
MTLVATLVLLWSALRWQGLNAVSDVIGIGSALLPLVVGLVAWAWSRRFPDGPLLGRTAEMDALMLALTTTMERVQYSTDRLNRLTSGLVEMRDVLDHAIARLDDRKRALDRDLAARRPHGAATVSAAERARLQKEIGGLRQELADTRQRLREAERLRGEVEQRLAEARRGQDETGELRDRTRAQAAKAQRLLMTPRAPVAPAVSSAAALQVIAIEPADLLGEGDQDAAAKILRRVDEVLQENAAVRDRLHDELAESAATIREHVDARARAAVSGPGRRRRRALPLLIGGCCSAVLLTMTVMIVYLPPPDRGRPSASGTATPGTPAPVPVNPAFYPRAVPAWEEPFTSSANIASAITVWRGTVYFGGNDGELHALDVDTGKSVWTGSQRLHGDITARPAIADGTRTLYVISNRGFYSEVSARDTSRGGEVWTRRIPGYIDESAVVAGDTVYFGAGDGDLYALDAADGHTRWKYHTDGWITSTPVVADDVVYFGSWDGHVYAVDTRTHQAKWSTYVPFRRIANDGKGNALYSPALANGVLYIGDKNYDLLALDIADGSIKWRAPTKDIVDSRPVVADGVVYVGSRDHNVYAFDAATGRPIWTALTGNAVVSDPVVSNGVVYVGSNDAYLYAFDAANGHVLWVHSTGNSVYSSPAVSDGVVYVGSDDNKLYALKTAR